MADLMPVRFQRAVDGDTFVFLAARYGSWEIRATVDHYRLWEYMARELHDKTSDVSGRVSGVQAQVIAHDVLSAATIIQVTERGLDKYGRILAEVWCDGVSLGNTLFLRHAVIKGSAKGIAELREAEGR